MKKIIPLIIISIILSSCSDRIKIYDDPIIYNHRLASLVIKVQNPLDSLETYLLNYKYNLESDTALYNSNNFDRKLTDSLLLRTKNQIHSSIEELKIFDYKTDDNNYKETVEKSLQKIEISLNENFKPIIDTLSSSQIQSSKNILLSILPYGKAGYLAYKSAIDSIINKQLEFSSAHNYVINEHLIRFNF